MSQSLRESLSLNLSLSLSLNPNQARLCAEEAIASSKGDRGARPLSVGEIELSWQDGLREVLMARYGL